MQEEKCVSQFTFSFFLKLVHITIKHNLALTLTYFAFAAKMEGACLFSTPKKSKKNIFPNKLKLFQKAEKNLKKLKHRKHLKSPK